MNFKIGVFYPSLPVCPKHLADVKGNVVVKDTSEKCERCFKKKFVKGGEML